MKQLAPFIVMIVILIVIAVIILALFNYKLKRRILDAGPLDEHALSLLGRISGSGTEALKWGCLLLFGGTGLVITALLPYQADSSPLPYGVVCIFLALGFIVYYLLVRKGRQ